MQFTSTQEQTLSGLIKQELAAAESMHKLLLLEYEALTDGDPDKIKPISDKKIQQMRLMEQLLTKRNGFLLKLGIATDNSGTEEAIAGVEFNSELRAQWDRLRSVTLKLQKQNDINGGIITIGQRRVKQALDILSGKENLTGTYSQEGETTFTKSNNLHTKA
jgi:flagellar biosynthesis/type III secretory pathway chaperone